MGKIKNYKFLDFSNYWKHIDNRSHNGDFTISFWSKTIKGEIRGILMFVY